MKCSCGKDLIVEEIGDIIIRCVNWRQHKQDMERGLQQVIIQDYPKQIK